MSSKALTIRHISRLDEMYAVEELQKIVWGVADREIFPALAMVAMNEVGAVLIGAFDGNQLVGFVFGFPGLEDGRAILHSDLLAVNPVYRSENIGYRLKLAQRQSALQRGIKKITWTFDPLQSLNAHFNFAKLGVIGTSYKIDFYGETTSPLHSLGTDRLWVEWLLEHPRVLRRISRERGPQISDEAAQKVVLDLEPEDETKIDSQEMAIHIPVNITQLKIDKPQTAIAWRNAIRKVFLRLFSHGFLITDFNRAFDDSFGTYRFSRFPEIPF